MKIKDLKSLAKLKSMKMTRRIIRNRKLKAIENDKEDEPVVRKIEISGKKVSPVISEKIKSSLINEKDEEDNDANNDKSLDHLFMIYPLLLKINSLLGIIAIIVISIHNILAPTEIERGKFTRMYPAPAKLRVWEKSKSIIEFKGGLANQVPTYHLPLMSISQG